MAERYIVQTTSAVDHAYRTDGTLAGWQRDVAAYAAGNSRLVLAISAAFAAPLIYPTASESGGFHFRGKSSGGKTTALIVAGSVWGGGGVRGFVRSWRATSNGLEGVAAMHCDCLLCLDELSQIDAKEASAAAYMLANGVGKSRASRDGFARPAAEWRLMFLSSGEISLADKIREDTRVRRAAAGQEVRVIDIASDAGAGLGMFENLHGFTSGDAFADHLRNAAKTHYGHASRAYLEQLTADFEAIAPAVKELRQRFVAEHCPKNADGQVSRVAARFGLVAAGGEMATAFGVLPWQPGEALAAAARCFNDWIAARGGVEPAEVREGITQVRSFLLAHGQSRFEPAWASSDDRPRVPLRDLAGYRKSDGEGWDYFVTTSAWRDEICRGFDAKALAGTMAERGLLLTPEHGPHRAKAVTVPGVGKLRLYHVPASFLEEHAHA
jgi:uncharacterized protein (DUF927 family)